MTDAKKTVKVRALGMKSASLPHTETGDPGTTIDRVRFNADGTAEVSQAVAKALLEHYPQSVVVVG